MFGKKVKQFCFYFYNLKLLLGEQMLVIDYAIVNSIDNVDNSSLMTRKISATTRTELTLDNKDEELDGLSDTQFGNDATNTNLDSNLDNSDITLATSI